MLTAIILFLCVLGSGSKDKYCRCELIEFNTVYRDDCEPFRQVIFWQWSAEQGRYNARGWVPADQVEVIDSKRISVRGWTVEGTIRHTETGFDPERHNALLFPPDKRRTMPWERSSGFYPCP